MAATPQYAAFTFKGQSGRIYNKDAYFSDVAGASIRWDAGQGASSTSETFWVPPEPVTLMDMAIVTGMVDTTKAMLTRDGVATGDIIRYSVRITTLAYRTPLRTPVGAGQKFTAIQLT